MKKVVLGFGNLRLNLCLYPSVPAGMSRAVFSGSTGLPGNQASDHLSVATGRVFELVMGHGLSYFGALLLNSR